MRQVDNESSADSETGPPGPFESETENCSESNNTKPPMESTEWTESLHCSSRTQSTFVRLIEACKLKDLHTIRRLVGARAELANQSDRHQRSLLHYAAILVDDNQGGESEEEEEDEDSVRDDDAQAVPKRSVECFNYLTQCCEKKLWQQQDLDGLSVLHLAVISSNVPLVRNLIFDHAYSSKYSLVSTLDNESHSPLHWAVITNNLECVKLLIGYGGAQLAHAPDLNGATPLHYATQARDYPKYRRQLRRMLKNVCSASGEISSSFGSATGGQRRRESSNRQQTDSKREQRRPPARSRARSRSQALQRTAPGLLDSTGSAASDRHRPGLEILEFLVRLAHIELECVDRDQRTALLWAASSGNRDAIMLLAAHGANLAARDANGLGPLHCAASHGFTDCLECLLTLEAAPERQTGATKARRAVSESSGRRGSFAGLQVDQVDNLNCTPLFYAVLSGNTDCVEALLERGAQCDWQDGKGRTAAHFAALKGQLSGLRLLRERGANLWLANKQGDLPLHYAIKSGRQQVARWLLENSPYERAVNAINNFGRAPIHLAVMKGNPEMVAYLIACGANLNQLVKVRDKPCRRQEPSRGQERSSATSLVNGSGYILTQNGHLYHYETALDMAQRLANEECIKLLSENEALAASQVIKRRITGNPSRAGGSAPGEHQMARNSRSLFDLQTVEGPSPIGFETSCSSASPSQAVNLRGTPQQARLAHTGSLQEQIHSLEGESVPPPGGALVASGGQLPRPMRPEPDSLPQTDSTGSSALSQSSLTSVRGLAPGGAKLRQPLGATFEGPAHGKPHSKPRSQDESNARGVENEEEHERNNEEPPLSRQSERPYRGGISYKNDRMSASIKCKLYGNSESACELPPLAGDFGGQSRAQHQRSFPSALKSASVCGRTSLSAPQESCSRSQEIITNVNVYASPWPTPATCPLHQQQQQLKSADQCYQCSRMAPPGGARCQEQRSGGQARQGNRRRAEQAAHQFPDPDTSDEASSDDMGHHFGRQQLPSLVAQDGNYFGALERPQEETSRSNGLDGMQTRSPLVPGARQRLRPSQGHEQHLPVIMSDVEPSNSAVPSANEERAGGSPGSESPPTLFSDGLEQGGPGEEYEGERSGRGELLRERGRAARDECSTDDQAELGAPPQPSSPAKLELRFDRAQRGPGKGAARHGAPGGQVRSPLREYIHGNEPLSPTTGRSSSLNRAGAEEASARGQRQAQLGRQQRPGADYSRVRAKVDSRRSRASRTTLALAHELDSAPSRSVSRQTFVKGPADGSLGGRQGSLESLAGELSASRVERSIRKYRQERKLFEELQNLKRNQIRSGRANEALAVKRMVQHFRQDTLDSIGLEIYHGPYTYGAYERFLYDQLRRLSQSNCAKLAGFRAEEQREFSPEQLLRRAEGEREQRDYLEEDLRADLELRRVTGAELSPEEREGVERNGQQLEETSEAVGGPLQGGEPQKSTSEPIGAGQAPVERDSKGELSTTLEGGDDLKANWARRVNEEAEKAGENERRVSEQSASSSSRRSSAEVEREKLFSLPLKTSESVLQEQADALSSRIVVDALGNVSRQASAKHAGGQTDEASYQLAAKAADQTVLSSSSSGSSCTSLEAGERDEGGPGEEEEEGDRLSDTLAQTGRASGGQLRSRRRSEINIGNKLEVIYHDVGIEIEPAADSDGAASSSSRDARQAREEREEKGESRQLDECREAYERSPESSATPERRRLEADSVKSRRRGSSPPAYNGSGGQWVTSRRASSGSVKSIGVGPDEPAGEAKGKRVFNGYDLDRLHGRRSWSPPERSEESERQRGGRGRAKAEEDRRGDDDRGARASLRERSDRTISEKFQGAQPPGSPRARFSGQQRRRLPRSRLTHARYQPPRVPMDEVRRRWAHVKADQRQLCRRNEEEEELVGQFGGQKSSSMAKSQPNLKRSQREESAEHQVEMGLHERPNYILLYEINERAKVSSETGAPSGGGGQKRDLRHRQLANWCRKRAVRIVDVRTLKRTLSLPESLIYSNDLLKRFNILKL